MTQREPHAPQQEGSRVGDGKTVVVLGGGIGGLTAAHELAERGFQVVVCEREEQLGGKARSLGKPGSAGPGRRPLPGEHGFRFFPFFYRHIPDTMRRIPYGGKTVLENLEWASRVGFAQAGMSLVELPIRLPRTWGEFGAGVMRFIRAFRHGLGLGVAKRHGAYFGWKMLCFMVSCDRRRKEQYERQPWWEFIGARTRGPAYEKFLAAGLTRSLVAMKAEVASTRTVGAIMAQMLRDLLHPGRTLDRILDGPTSEVWIDPWVEYLEHLANNRVRILRRARVSGLQVRGGRIVAATVKQNEKRQVLKADYFVAALPAEALYPLVTRRVRACAPSLRAIGNLEVEWMNGIQFYLARDLRFEHGHLIHVDSPWALTSVAQQQFWVGEHRPSRFGRGDVRGILSVDISDWNRRGLRLRRSASRCSRQEIADEVWHQLMVDLQHAGSESLRNSDLLDWYLDPSIVTVGRASHRTTAAKFTALRRRKTVRDVATLIATIRDQPARGARGNPPARVENLEPLLINTVGSWKLRPESKTGIPNLFLAADYVRTHTGLATMEAANEAARCAVNLILEECGASQSNGRANFIQDHRWLGLPLRLFPPSRRRADAYCRVWGLREWWWLWPYRKLDSMVFQLGRTRHGEGLPAALALVLTPALFLMALLGLLRLTEFLLPLVSFGVRWLFALTGVTLVLVLGLVVLFQLGRGAGRGARRRFARP